MSEPNTSFSISGSQNKVNFAPDNRRMDNRTINFGGPFTNPVASTGHNWEQTPYSQAAAARWALEDEPQHTWPQIPQQPPYPSHGLPHAPPLRGHTWPQYFPGPYGTCYDPVFNSMAQPAQGYSGPFPGYGPSPAPQTAPYPASFHPPTQPPPPVSASASFLPTMDQHPGPNLATSTEPTGNSTNTTSTEPPLTEQSDTQTDDGSSSEGDRSEIEKGKKNKKRRFGFKRMFAKD